MGPIGPDKLIVISILTPATATIKFELLTISGKKNKELNLNYLEFPAEKKNLAYFVTWTHYTISYLYTLSSKYNHYLAR